MKNMFRYYQLLFVGASVTMLFAACAKKDDYVQKSIKEVTGDYPSVFSIDEYQFNPLGSSAQFSYASEGNWSVVERPTWVNVSPESGKEGRTIVTITAPINQEWETLAGTLSFKGQDGTIHSISLKQDCPQLRLSVRPLASDLSTNIISISEKGAPNGQIGLPFLWSHANSKTQPVELTITSNIDWRLSLDQGEWFKVYDEQGNDYKTIEGNGNKVLYLNTTSNNYSKEDVADNLKLTAFENGNYEQTISPNAIANWTIDLSQTHLKFLIGVKEDSLTHEDMALSFDELGYIEGTSSFEQSLFVDCELPWRISSTNFVKFDDSSDGVANNIVSKTIHIQHSTTNSRVNYTLGGLNDQVVFSAFDGAGNTVAERIVEVEQMPYVFSLDETSLTLDNGVYLQDGSRVYSLEESQEPLIHSIQFHTTGMWIVDELTAEEQEWLVIDPETQSGGISRADDRHVIRFWVKKQNLSMEDIVAHIRVRANYSWVTDNHLEDLQGDVRLAQERFIFEGSLADTSPLSATQLFTDGHRKSINISSSGPWRLCVMEKDGQMKPVNQSNESWVTVSSENGNSSANDNISSVIEIGAISANPSDDFERQTVIYLQSLLHESLSDSERLGYTPVEIPVVQRRFTFKVNNKEGDSDYALQAYKVSFDDKISIESDGNWVILEQPDWIASSPASANLSDGDVNMSVSLNPKVYGNMEKPRTGDIKIRCTFPGRNDIERVIHIEQSALTFRVSSTDDTDFPSACNFPYNNSFYGADSWAFNLEAPDGFPWELVREEGTTMSLSNNRPSDTSGYGALLGGNLYPSYNPDSESKVFRFYFVARDSRYETEVKTTSVQLTQSGFEWGTNAIDDKTFDALGNLLSGSNAVNFICSGPWEFVGAPTWMNQSGIAFTSDPNFTVRVNNNTQVMNVSRNANVTIRSLMNTEASKTFYLSQHAYYFDNATPDRAAFTTLDAADQTVSFQCSGQWELTNTSGVVVSSTAGDGSALGGELTIKYHPDDYFDENQDHNSYFIIRSRDNNSFTKEIPYYQPRYVFAVSTSSIKPDGPKDVSSHQVNITVTAGDSWEANASNNSILNMSSTAGNGNGSFTVTPVVNYTQEERSAIITVKTRRGQKSRQIEFKQPAYRFSVDATVNFTSEAEAKDIAVTSDGNWTLEKKTTADWLTIGTTSGGAGQISVTLSASKNATGNSRSVELVLKGIDNSSLEKTINVTQAP